MREFQLTPQAGHGKRNCHFGTRIRGSIGFRGGVILDFDVIQVWKKREET